MTVGSGRHGNDRMENTRQSQVTTRGANNRAAAKTRCPPSLLRLESARLQDLTCVTSQQADVEPTPAKNRDKGARLEIRHQQHLSLIREASLRDPSSLPSLSRHQLSLAVYCLSLLAPKLCKSSNSPPPPPSSAAVAPLCFSTGFGSIPGGSLRRRLKDFVFVLLAL